MDGLADWIGIMCGVIVVVSCWTSFIDHNARGYKLNG